MVKDAPDGVEEFAHDGDDGLFGFLAASQESLIAGIDLRAVTDGHQCRQKERGTQMGVARLAQAAGFMDRSARFKGPGIQPGMSDPLRGLEALGQHEQFAQDAQPGFVGDAGHRGQQRQGFGQKHTGLSHCQRLLFQREDAALQVRDVQAQVAGDDFCRRRDLFDGGSRGGGAIDPISGAIVVGLGALAMAAQRRRRAA